MRRKINEMSKLIICEWIIMTGLLLFSVLFHLTTTVAISSFHAGSLTLYTYIKYLVQYSHLNSTIFLFFVPY